MFVLAAAMAKDAAAAHEHAADVEAGDDDVTGMRA
jgi:hypothetical protein